MLKYLIIPRWLYSAMSNENIALTSLLNFEIMSSLLSGVELSFYIHCNNVNYRSFGSLFENPKLMSRICSGECQNCISVNSDFMDYMKGNDFLFNADKPLLPYLFLNPINTHNKSLAPYDFKPILISKDTLGLITTLGLAANKNHRFSLRRDIYDVMRKFMSVDDVIKSPLFGV